METRGYLFRKLVKRSRAEKYNMKNILSLIEMSQQQLLYLLHPNREFYIFDR